MACIAGHWSETGQGWTVAYSVCILTNSQSGEEKRVLHNTVIVGQWSERAVFSPDPVSTMSRLHRRTLVTDWSQMDSSVQSMYPDPQSKQRGKTRIAQHCHCRTVVKKSSFSPDPVSTMSRLHRKTMVRDWSATVCGTPSTSRVQPSTDISSWSYLTAF